MRNVQNPKWLFLINTVPIILLFFLLWRQFDGIKTLLTDDSIQLWKTFGLCLGALGFFTFVYAVYAALKKKTVSVWFGLAALFLYIPFLYLYIYHLEAMIPFSIPRWMISDNIFLYAGTLLMPTLAYSLFILVVHFTSENKEYKAWVSFSIAIAIPVLGYLFTQIVLPLWNTQWFEHRFMHVLIVLLIVITLVFLFFLIRGVYILAVKKAAVWRKYQWAWKIPLAVVFPLLGLLINNGYVFGRLFHADGSSGIFGDFSNIWFYILAIINGMLICLPNVDNKIYRLLIFLGRSITFPYTLYFFLVFLPFLPVSVIAVIAIGTGFLMLIPLLLFAIHINELSEDFAFLQAAFSKRSLFTIPLFGFLIIPACITVSYLTDKSVLNKALTYVYSPDYSKQYSMDTVSLQKTLRIIKNHKNSDHDFIFMDSVIPYLSSYFNWLVLDNLTLSDEKISFMERIFFDEPAAPSTYDKPSGDDLPRDDVQISKISISSAYDNTQRMWKSWVDMEITDSGTNNRPAEYAATINLPEGCWISDYYLYVGDKKEYGILAEKRTALWTFSQIRNENKDPGILYYLTGNKVAFRVFPFAKNEVRKTGIEFLHKEPVQLHIDNRSITLGTPEKTVYENSETANAIYISSRQKQSLPSVRRKPYFYFLIDASHDTKNYIGDFTERIEGLLKDNPSLAEGAQIGFVDSTVKTIALDDTWRQHYAAQPFKGGFYLDRAIRTVLFQAYRDMSASYPVIVAVTDNMQRAIVKQDFSDWSFAFPESNVFFHLDRNGTLKEHSLTDNPLTELSPVKRDCMFCESVLEYKQPGAPAVYLPHNDQPSVMPKRDASFVSEMEMKERHWESALHLHGVWKLHILYPETSQHAWLKLIKDSFDSKIMTPLTSYIVVENEAQKTVLKRKQEQVLSGNRALDIGEDVQSMSEPSLWIAAAMFLIVCAVRHKRRLAL